MNQRRSFLVIFGVLGAMIYLPHWFGIPYPVSLAGQALLGGRPYYTTYVDYSSFFEPFSDFAREHLLKGNGLPLWSSHALFGLPMIEQSEHSILNPLQWLLWLGGGSWRILVTAAYLIWGAWGMFRLQTDVLRHPRSLSVATALLYGLAGAAPHGLGDFCCLIHVMILPHLLRYAAALAANPERAVRPFLALTACVTLLLLTGQPQYLLVGGLGIGLVLLIFTGLIRRPSVLLPYATAGLIALLLAAPMLLPFLEANLSGMAYPGNHQLVGSASYWKINLLTFSQLLCHRLTGFVGLTWFAADRPTLTISYESFSIAFGSVAALAALVGSVTALRYLWRRRVSVAGAMRAAAGIGALALLALLGLHNLSGDQAYPWFFRFVNLAKYSPPVLALLLCLAIPGGLRVFARSGGTGRLLFWLAGCAIPLGYLTLLLRAQAHTVDDSLRHYSLLATFLPLAGLGLLAWAGRALSPVRLQQALALLLAFETLLLVSWGMPLAYEYGRWALLLGFMILLGLALRHPDWSRSMLGIALVAGLAGLVILRQQTEWPPPDRSDYVALGNVSQQHAATHGYTPRILTSQYMTQYPYNAEFGLRTIVSRCPVVPLATQALLFDHVEPAQLLTQQRRLSFLEFHGAIPPDAEGYLSWSHFARNPTLLDQWGVDYVTDYDSGPLARNPALLQAAFPTSHTVGRNIVLRGREQPAGRARFHPEFVTVAFTPDAWNVRRVWRAEEPAAPHRPVVEIDSRRVPKWEEMVQHSWFEFATQADTVGRISYVTDRNGHFSAQLQTDGPGLFVYQEQFWPGWEARLNGLPVPILRVDSLFQGILVHGSGSWAVEFHYVGTLRRDLLFTMAGGALALLAVLLLRRYYQPVEDSLRQ